MFSAADVFVPQSCGFTRIVFSFAIVADVITKMEAINTLVDSIPHSIERLRQRQPLARGQERVQLAHIVIDKKHF